MATASGFFHGRSSKVTAKDQSRVIQVFTHIIIWLICGTLVDVAQTNIWTTRKLIEKDTNQSEKKKNLNQWVLADSSSK